LYLSSISQWKTFQKHCGSNCEFGKCRMESFET